jgi:hypothetical protein
MKIGKVHRTQSSSLYSANTSGAPMHPAPIGTQKKIVGPQCLVNIAYWRGGHQSANILYWRTDAPCLGRYHTEAASPTQLLALDNINFTLPNGGPNSLVRLAYFHANCLLSGLYKRETEIC